MNVRACECEWLQAGGRHAYVYERICTHGSGYVLAPSVSVSVSAQMGVCARLGSIEYSYASDLVDP